MIFSELGITEGRPSLRAEGNKFHCGHAWFSSLLNHPYGVESSGWPFVP